LFHEPSSSLSTIWRFLASSVTIGCDPVISALMPRTQELAAHLKTMPCISAAGAMLP
jgi:hypothetical protein